MNKAKCEYCRKTLILPNQFQEELISLECPFCGAEVDFEPSPALVKDSKDIKPGIGSPILGMSDSIATTEFHINMRNYPYFPDSVISNHDQIRRKND